eukprot:COSAG06_NODE_250_length_19080_cov_6.483029_7_plen_197_part_00
MKALRVGEQTCKVPEIKSNRPADRQADSKTERGVGTVADGSLAGSVNKALSLAHRVHATGNTTRRRSGCCHCYCGYSSSCSCYWLCCSYQRLRRLRRRHARAVDEWSDHQPASHSLVVLEDYAVCLGELVEIRREQPARLVHETHLVVTEILRTRRFSGPRAQQADQPGKSTPGGQRRRCDRERRRAGAACAHRPG